MRDTILFLALMLFASVASAADPWDRTDKILLGTTMTTAVLDYGQTMHIARNPEDWRELNPILGEHPSTTAVRNYFIVGTATKILVAAILPSKWRKAWLGGITLGTGFMVIRNYTQGRIAHRQGADISFSW